MVILLALKQLHLSCEDNFPINKRVVLTVVYLWQCLVNQRVTWWIITISFLHSHSLLQEGHNK
jgi:hypothetical protein